MGDPGRGDAGPGEVWPKGRGPAPCQALSQGASGLGVRAHAVLGWGSWEGEQALPRVLVTVQCRAVSRAEAAPAQWMDGIPAAPPATILSDAWANPRPPSFSG